MTRVRDPDLVGALLIFVTGIVAIAAALTTPDPGFGVVGPAVLPTALGVLVLVAAAWLAVEAVRRRDVVSLGELERRPLALSVVATALFLAAFVPVGFLISTVAFLVAEARILGSARPVRDAIAAVIFAAGLYVLFVRVLGVDLPRGPLPL